MAIDDDQNVANRVNAYCHPAPLFANFLFSGHRLDVTKNAYNS